MNADGKPHPRSSHAITVAIHAVIAVALLGVAVATPALAQPLATVSAPAGYRTWNIKANGIETTVSQFCVPVTASVPLSPAIDLFFASAASNSQVAGAGTTAELTGAAALQTQLHARFLDRRLLVQMGVTVPSGKRALDLREVEVAQMLGLPVLGFGLRQLGRGLEWGGGASLAMPMRSGVMASAGIGGVIREPFELLAGHDDFRPAPELAITAGADAGEPLGDRGRPLRADLTYRLFGRDQQSGQAVFEEGGQLEIQAQTQQGGDGFQSRTMLRAVIKADNRAIGPTGSTIGDLEASSGNSLVAHASGDWPWRNRGRVGLEGEWNLIGGSDTFARNGRAFGVGPSLDWSFRRGFELGVRAMYLWGSLDAAAGGSRMDLRGSSYTAMLQWAPPS